MLYSWILAELWLCCFVLREVLMFLASTTLISVLLDHEISYQFSSVQSLSRVGLFSTPWIAACQASLSITNSRSSLRLTSIESVMPSSHLILCCPLFSCPQSLPASESFPMSQLRMRWPKYWSFSFSIIPSKEHPGPISFIMDTNLISIVCKNFNLVLFLPASFLLLWS